MNREVTERVGIQQLTTYSIFKKLIFYRFNDPGAHLLTVDIWEQPLSVGPYIFLCEAIKEYCIT